MNDSKQPKTLGEMSPEFFEAVCGPTPTIDPNTIKAGDTVTLQGEKASVSGEVQAVELRTDVGRVVKLHRSWFRIDGPSAWTLTAHQPAPEPEPRGLLADTIFEAIRDQPDSHSKGAEVAADAVRAKFVVIDPAAAKERVAEIVRARMGGPVEAWSDIAAAVVDQLGIEAP